MNIRILILLVAIFFVAYGPKKGVVNKKKKINKKTENVVKLDSKVAKPKAIEKPVTTTPRKRSSVDTYIY